MGDACMSFGIVRVFRTQSTNLCWDVEMYEKIKTKGEKYSIRMKSENIKEDSLKGIYVLYSILYMYRNVF